ncbi:MAG: opacity protein [Novosphingopyxis baekryungensis]|jgi:outer membrane immunogenic protein|nr:opacity protein [Novosphingopyxis baekryungensis]
MNKTTLLTAAILSLAPAPLFAQNGDVEAPDGTPAFGFEPYVAIGGGYDIYDTTEEPSRFGVDSTEGAVINGIVGANVPLGPLFVGAEGFASKGFNELDWEYGAAGRFGVRVGDSGLFYGRVGYMWVEGRESKDPILLDAAGNQLVYDGSIRDRDGVIYGIGAEVGPKDIGLGGLTGNSGARLRFGVDTFKDFNSFRPSAAVVFHF